MQKNNLDNWLRLSLIKGLGSVTIKGLLEHFDSARDIIEADVLQLKKLGLKQDIIKQLKNNDNTIQINKTHQWLGEDKINFALCIDDKAYPEKLKQIDSPPIILFGKGDVDVLNTCQISVVGSRNATPTGIENAHAFSSYLVQYGLTVTSGLALGIDAASHVGALAKKGLTVAVVATGMDIIYPPQNTELAHKIIKSGGCIISEYQLGVAPRPQHFPQRNRIISALSLGVLVVEAADKSGSLITARLASEQGHEVFAIPGSIHNPQSRGCHKLIKTGAILVESGLDIFNEIADLVNRETKNTLNEKEIKEKTNNAGDKNTKNTKKFDVEYQKLLDCMEYEPQPLDILHQRCGLPIDKISSMMLMLELQQVVTKHPGGMYLLSGKKE
ncbi:MAG: DNA-protecting protein DprA [Gammaproteobacteria bacterium]|nr:MAG: DNA-protecting protein DprA [Gammaproteobacteria bacterium]